MAHRTIPLIRHIPDLPPEAAARRFHAAIRLRRTIRSFSSRAVSLETIEQLVAAAGTAPSGANKQPWRFVAVQDPLIKREIRVAAEAEEREFYEHRASPGWLADLEPFGTDPNKPFLEIAPWIVVVFKLMRDENPSNPSDQVYYVNESVGIAVGLFLAAAHLAGLATLTHTPSPMKFLGPILRRPDHERPFLVIPVGYPSGDCEVPDISRKSLSEILVVDRPAAAGHTR